MKSGYAVALRTGAVCALLCAAGHSAIGDSIPRFAGTGKIARLAGSPVASLAASPMASGALQRGPGPAFDLSAIPVFFEKDPGKARFRTRTASDALLFETGGFRLGFGGSPNGVRFRFSGSRPGIQPAGWQATGSYSNYFLSNRDPKVPTRRQHFAAVRYEAVWPGIDLLFYGPREKAFRELEYDFQVSPLADTARIRLAVDGAASVSINSAGELHIRNRFGETKQRPPTLYQMAGGKRVPVTGGYRLYGRNRVGFWVGPYDHTRPLVIDPVLEFSTYLGGQGYEVATGIAVDNANNIYVTGYTQFDDFAPGGSTPKKFVSRNISTQDVFLVKLNGATKQVIYVNYYGGSNFDQPWAVAVDSQGGATVVGVTASSDLPVVNAYLDHASLTALGQTYGFAVRFTPDGATVDYSTYTAWGLAYGVALNSAGAAWVVGAAPCITDDIPTDPRFHEFVPTPDAGQSVCTPGVTEVPYTGYIVRIARGGNKEYATFYTPPTVTGSQNYINDAAVDSQDNLYVAGTMHGTHQVTRYDPSSQTDQPNLDFDAYIAKFDRFGRSQWTHNLGGEADEEGLRIAVDANSNAYMTGYTTSLAFPVTGNAFQKNAGSPSRIPNADLNALGDSRTRPLVDGFVARYDPLGKLLAASYLGGNGDDIGFGIAVDSSGRAYVTGYTNSRNFPITPGAFQTSFGGGQADAFVSAIAPDFTRLDSSTFFGGTGQDEGYQVALDRNGNLYLAGGTQSADLPLTPDALQTVSRAGDALVAKLNLQPCIASLVSGRILPSGGGVVTLTVNTDTTTCAWSLTNPNPWLTIAPTSGIGTTPVQLTFTQNAATTSRLAVVSLNGRRNFLFQDGQSACRYVLFPGELVLSSNSERRQVAIQAPDPSCAWSVQSDQPWLKILSPASGNGTGAVTIGTDQNNGSTVRLGNLTIGTQKIAVGQSAGQCTITLSSETGAFGPAGGLGTVQLLASSDQCPWTAQTQVDWISIFRGASGYGNGRITLGIAPNTAGVARTGTVLIGAQAFGVTQDPVYSKLRDQSTTTGSVSAASGAGPGTQAIETSAGPLSTALPLTSPINTSPINTSPLNTSPGLGRRALSPAPRGSGDLGKCGSQKPAAPIQLDATGRQVQVTVARSNSGCPITVSSLGNAIGQAWMTVTLADPSVVNPVINVSATPNPSADVRKNYIQVVTGDTAQGSWQLEVLQAGVAKVPLAVPARASLSADSGSANLNVSAADGVSACTWTLVTDQLPAWVKPAGTYGVCGTPLQFAYDANPNSSTRLGSIKFNTDDVVQLEQAPAKPPCAFSFQVQQFNIGAGGDTVTFNVKTDAGCSWSLATNHDTWVTFPSGNTGTGPGPLAVQVLANDTTSQRTLTVTVDQVAGYVLQAAASSFPPACAFTLSPNSASFTGSGGTGTFQVQTDPSCAWKAVVATGAGWVTLTAGAGSTGPGPVSFTVDSNPPGSAARTTTVSVQDAIFTIAEDAGPTLPPNCAYTLSPGSANFANAGGSGSFHVQTSAGCRWSGTAGAPWVKLQTASGTGPGQAAFTVDSNPPGNAARNTAISVQGTNFTVNQDAGASTGSSISASPNPVTACNAQGLGKTTIAWSANAPGNIEIHIGTPDGSLFASGQGGTQDTGEWIGAAATTFYLIAGPTVLAQTSVKAACVVIPPAAPTGTLTATPGSLPLCSPPANGAVTLAWTTANVTSVEIRQGTFNGNRLAAGGANGTAIVTVPPSTVLVLVDASGTAPPTSQSVLATVTIQPAACPNQVGIAPPTGDLAESNRDWAFEFLDRGANSGGAVRDITDPLYILTGAYSMLLQTDGATQVRMTRTIPGAGWNLSAINMVTFALTIDFPGGDWQFGSPYIVLKSSAGGTLTLTPNSNVAANADQDWVTLSIPLAGSATWRAVTNGAFDMRSVTQLQVSFDSTVTGWDLLLDSLFLQP